MTLSIKATCDFSGQEHSSYFVGLQEYEKNPYDEIKNPGGIIQMGLAENQLSFDLLEKWLQENPDASRFRRNGESIFKELALFQDYHGLPAFKNALIRFMSEIRGNKVSFDPNKLVLTAGATSANETLIFCLADSGDAFLLPTPYYPGFDRDLKWRTGVEIVPIQCTSCNGFKITAPALEEAFQLAQTSNLKVKGILVTNPSNPLGKTLTRNELELLVNFINAKGIHLISDEIYSATVFSSPRFISVMEVLERKFSVNSVTRNCVHMVYSLSKDLGLPGFRVGAIYSNDRTVVSAATKMSSFGLVSSQTQSLLAAMLSDKRFTKNYVVENKKRLKSRHAMLLRGLKMAGMSCLESNSGLFCWVDARHLLRSQTFEAEMELWRKILYDIQLNISPGSSCHCVEPGWFRVCSANMSEEALNLAIRRIKTLVDSISFGKGSNAFDNNYNSRTNLLGNWVSRLSYSHKRER